MEILYRYILLFFQKFVDLKNNMQAKKTAHFIFHLINDFMRIHSKYFIVFEENINMSRR